MQLFWSPTSPYVRKVMAAAIARGIDGRIICTPTRAHASPPDLLAANPLSKVPALITDDGLALFDSPVIVEYLDSIGDAAPLFPAAGGARWRALRLQALADGIMDAAVGRRGEMGKPQDAGRTVWMERQKAAVERSVAALEADPPPARPLTIGVIAVACALGYLDFRFGHEPWRDGRPRLTAWLAPLTEQPWFTRTVPKDPA